MNDSKNLSSGHADSATWRKSSFSVDYACVGVADLDGDIGVRNTNRPGAGTLHLSPEQFAGWVTAIKAGRFDDMA